MMYGYGYDSWGVVGWIVMGTMMLLLWGGIAVLIVYLVRGANTRGHTTTPAVSSHDDPERLLAQRFARGEIDETEYKARLDALRRP